MKFEGKKKSFIVDWVLPLAIALVIALLIKHFLVFQVRIPSGSMIPTLNIGDRLFVSKYFPNIALVTTAIDSIIIIDNIYVDNKYFVAFLLFSISVFGNDNNV